MTRRAHQVTLSTRRLPAFLLLLLTALWPATAVAEETGELYGHARTTAADGQPLYLQGAKVALTSKTDPSRRYETATADDGAYHFTGLPAGLYTLTVTLEGYEDATREVTIEAGSLLELTLEMKLKPVRAEIEVRAEAEGIQPEQTSPKGTVRQETLQNAPLISERFQDALPLVPGVVRGADGLIKIKGAASTQTGWLVNSANVTDPVTGERAINLPSDVIQEVEVLANPYDAQYGKFAGAVTSVETARAGDKWKYSLQNFLPRPRRREGGLRGIESFTPRFTVSGPIVKDRFSIVQSFEYRFVRSPVTSLPVAEQDTELESFDSFTQLDFTLNQNHFLTGVFTAYPQKNRYANLNTFNPQEVTANRRQKGWMAGLQDRYLFSDGSLLESTFSVKDYDVDIYPADFGRRMLFLPERVFGSFFNTQERITRRYEFQEVYNFRPRQARGEHLLRLGLNVTRSTFRGFHASTPVDIEPAATGFFFFEGYSFSGSPFIGRDQTEYALWLQDKWSPRRRLTFDFGARYDYSTLSHESNVSPRFGFAYVLTDDNRTLLRGGVGLFYDKVPLNVGTFEQLQRRTLVVDCNLPCGIPPYVASFRNRVEDIEHPRSLAFNLELDRELMQNLLLRVGYLQREGRREYVLNPLFVRPGMVDRFDLLLAPSGMSRYREVQVTFNYRFREDSFLNASYVHSQSLGNLNRFEEYFGDFENPIIRADERSRLRHDAPDRVLLWGEVKLLWGVRWAPVLDVHSGFPFSLVDARQFFVGPRNQGGRYPVFASFDSQVWKDFKIKFRGKKRTVRIGVKVFNIFDHFNPRDVQQNIDAGDALGFYNSRGRIFRGKFSIEY